MTARDAMLEAARLANRAAGTIHLAAAGKRTNLLALQAAAEYLIEAGKMAAQAITELENSLDPKV